MLCATSTTDWGVPLPQRLAAGVTAPAGRVHPHGDPTRGTNLSFLHSRVIYNEDYSVESRRLLVARYVQFLSDYDAIAVQPVAARKKRTRTVESDDITKRTVASPGVRPFHPPIWRTPAGIWMSSGVFQSRRRCPRPAVFSSALYLKTSFGFDPSSHAFADSSAAIA